jgi:hypothetical protein
VTTATTDAEARGDLVEALLPDAAALAVAVREEPQEQIAARLSGLSRHELESLAVVLAAMVDPDRSIADALGWVDFDEYGNPLPSPGRSWASVRDAARPEPLDRRAGVDMAAVERALSGEDIPLNLYERRAAVVLGVQRGMGHDTVAGSLRMSREAVVRTWERTKARARKNGMDVATAAVSPIDRSEKTRTEMESAA